MRTAVTRSGWAASGVKCKWPCVGAKYALHSDTAFPAVLQLKLDHIKNLSVWSACFKAGDLHFYGAQTDQRTTGTPLYQVGWIAPRWGFPTKNTHCQVALNFAWRPIGSQLLTLPNLTDDIAELLPVALPFHSLKSFLYCRCSDDLPDIELLSGCTFSAIW